MTDTATELGYGLPGGKPRPYWKAPDDWFDFFRFTCPNCKLVYVVDHGADYPLECKPRPLAIESNWDVRTAKIVFSASVVCPCMVKFAANGTGGA